MEQALNIPPSFRPKSDEIKLFESSQERGRLEDLSDLYSIIKATELLEAAYSRDAISSTEYSEACQRIIAQFKATESALIHQKAIESTDKFMLEFQIDCPRAHERLVVVGVPATVVHAVGSDNRAGTVIVAETVQAFITNMDALRLGQRAVDEIQPLISDLTSSLVRVTNLPADFEGVVKMRTWLQKLNEMRAHDEIDDQESRQLLFDLENSYAGFLKHLQEGKPTK